MFSHRRALTAALALLLALFAPFPTAAQESDPQSKIQLPKSKIDPASQTLPLPLTGLAQLSAGSNHTCAVTTGGGLSCWGFNSTGQLGDGNDPVHSPTPVNVVGLGSGVAAVSAGASHTCALTTGGGVKCWGDNSSGQLGDNNAPTKRDTPVNVVGLGSGVAAISAGYGHTCAVTTSGAAKCWGDNGFGQLGDNDQPIDSDTPVNVVGLGSNVTAIAAGGFHTCALTSAGGVKCWGDNSYGQLGDNNAPTDSHTPVDVAGLNSGVAALAAGATHACALTTAGAIRCWGLNSAGQLGDGNQPTNSDTPVSVQGLTGSLVAINIAGNGGHTCALTATGGIKCWGDNAAGQLGDGHAPTDHDAPVDVLNLAGRMRAVATGGLHTCALTATGGIKCWGDNFYGQLGDGTRLARGLPNDVLAPTVCYELTRNRIGNGAVPTADPANTPNCPDGHYLPGQLITLLAASAVGARTNGWAGAANNATLNEVNYLIMPAADHAVSVTYATCRALTRSHSGSGADPVASPDRSVNCAANTYVSGETVTLIAKPNAGQRVASWSGADTNPLTGQTANTLTMPDADRAVSVAYETCFALSAVVAGQGDPISAAPPNSLGCAAGAYVAGQAIILTAAPATGWTIQGWGGTADNASTATTNALTMPAAAHAVGVTYTETGVPGGAPDLFLPSIQR